MAIDEKVENQNGVMQRLRNSLSSKKGKLVAGLGALALAGSIYATQPSQAYAEEPDHCDIVECVEGGVKLPDLSDWTRLEGERYVDKFDSIEGKETVQHCYKRENGTMIIVNYFDKNLDKPYSLAIRTPNGDIATYWDREGNEIFEQKTSPGQKAHIDFDAYKK